MTTAIEVGDLSGLIAIILAIMFLPPILFLIIGAVNWNRNNKKTAKIFFILAGVYLLVSLGICGSMMLM